MICIRSLQVRAVNEVYYYDQELKVIMCAESIQNKEYLFLLFGPVSWMAL